MRSILRVLTISVIAVIMTGTAYLAGFGTSWLMTQEANLPRAVQAVDQQEAQQTPTADRPANFEVFWEAWDHVRQNFYGEIPTAKEMTYGAIRGVLRTLEDPNTILVDPETAQVDRTQLEGEFEGIGAVVTMNEEEQLVVVSPMEGQPAMDAGLQSGDIILKVDGTEITGMSLTDAVLLIRGPRGTTVELNVLRPDTQETLTFEIVRARIETTTVSHRMLEDAPEIGYLRIGLFGERTAEELQSAIQDLQEQGAKSYIVDVRNNPGGLLRASDGSSPVVDVTSQFVAGGQVLVTEQWSDGRTREFESRGGGLLAGSEIPIVLLVNRGSASASEILAGAIQDLDRGILVGEKTFGKGSVQEVYRLSDQSQLNVTVAHWLTPNGDDINEDGILPDIVVEPTEEQIEAREDVQLERAIEVLQKELE